jgi:hypothetical protein
MAPLRPLALILLLSACGGLAETTARPSEKDAAAAASVPEMFDAAQLDAPAQAPSLLEDSGGRDASPTETGPSPCVAAGGTCLELVGCDGIGVDLACGWSASCCMPPTWDSGTCPPNTPLPGTPCDVSPYLGCAYAPCHDAICGGGGAEAGTWWVGADCSPPPPGG